MRRHFVVLVLGLASCRVPPSTPNPPRTAEGPRSDTISFETNEGTHLSFDVSPDGRYIIFDLLGQLWRIPTAGGEATAITIAVRDTSEDFDPAISPDGRRVAFESDRPGGRELWLMSADGGAARRLTSRDFAYFAYAAPSWAPDNRRLAYAVGDTLVVLDIVSGVERAVRIDSLPPGPPLNSWLGRAGMPSWSPDGTHLLFVNAADPSRGDGRVWEVAATGGVARPLTTGRALAPAWSPDATRLAFFARDSMARWQLWIQPRGGVARQLTNHQETVTYRARWLPDGSAIIYSADGQLWRVSPGVGLPAPIPFRARLTIPRRRAALHTVHFPDPGVERVAKGFSAIALSADARHIAMIALDTLWVGEVGAPLHAVSAAADAGDNGLTWSPNGEEVAWSRRDRPGGTYDLVASNIRTGAQRPLTAFARDVQYPSWSPDGKHIAFVAAGRLRVIDADVPCVEQLALARNLGLGGPHRTFAWSPSSDALVNFSSAVPPARSQNAQWIALDSTRRPFSGLSRAPVDLNLSADGHAFWVENNLIWTAMSDSKGVQGRPVPLSPDPAVEARYARDGSVLYLSAEGLRLRSPNGNVRSIPWPRYHSAAAPAPLLIRGARVIDGRGGPLSEPRDVLLSGSRIARIAPAGAIAAGDARVIDATGAYLVPGFIDLHSHVWEDVQLLGWLHNGVTTIRDVASQRVRTADARNAIEAGIRDGPRIVYAGAMFHGGKEGFSTLRDQVVSDSGSIARAVAIMAGMGAEYIKDRGFSRWDGAARLVSEAHRYGLPVSGHCEHILPVVAAGVDGAEHILDCFSYRGTLRSDYAELARASGEWIVPTAGLYFSMLRAMDDSALVTAPDVAPFLAPQYRMMFTADSAVRRSLAPYTAGVQRAERSLKRYHDAGVLLATGGDNPLPLAIQYEMEVFVESGLSPMEAIVAATSNAARVLNAPQIGTIAEGNFADLVLLNANPLADIRNTRAIRIVIKGGRIVDRARLREQGFR